MKKTGKVLSLVLSLALVASSLTATFASASTRSETATIKLSNDTIALANGGSGDSLKSPNLVGASYFKDFDTAELYDHSDVASSLEVKDVAITSGSDKVKLDKGTADDDGNLNDVRVILKNSTVSGKVTLAVRYGCTVSRSDDEDTKVYGTATYNVMIYDKDQAYIAGVAAAGDKTDDGSVPDDLDTLTRNYDTTNNKVVGVVEKASAKGSTDGALATWGLQKVYTAADVPTQVDTGNVASDDQTAADLYQLSISGSSATINAPVSTLTSTNLTTATSFTLINNATSDKLGTVGKVSIYAKEYAKETNTPYKLTDHLNTKTSVENKYTIGSETTISKYSSKTYIGTVVADSSNKGSLLDITGCDIVLPASGAITMESGKIGDVTAPDASTATFIVNDGSVGDIAIKAAVTINGGSVGDITIDTDKDLTINDGTVQDIDGNGNVTVEPTDEDSPIKIGKISATKNLQISSDDKAAVTTGDITCTEGGTISLTGDDVKVGAIDGDYHTSTLNLDSFKGSIAAPAHGYTEGLDAERHLTLNVAGDDTDATVTGAASLYEISMADGASLTFTDKVNVGDNGATGDGTLKFAPKALYTTGELTTSIRLTKDFKAGDVAFTAATDAVDEDSVTPVGFSVEKVATSTKIDSFKVKDINFASLAINGSSKIPLGTTETYTATTYPTGTKLPADYSIEWTFSGNSDYLEATADANDSSKISVKAVKQDTTFASLNKGTLTAYVVDADGFEDYDYPEATFDVSIGAKPVTYVSDTTGTKNMKVGETYQFKITSSDGSVPPFVVASNGATVAPYTKSGNSYLFKVTAAKTGDFGVYVGSRVCVLHITSGVTCDTTKVTIANGKTYQFKVTAPKTPAFVVAGIGAIKAVNVNGNNYFYKVTNNGKTGAAGVYVNGTRMAVITFTK